MIKIILNKNLVNEGLLDFFKSNKNDKQEEIPDIPASAVAELIRRMRSGVDTGSLEKTYTGISKLFNKSQNDLNKIYHSLVNKERDKKEKEKIAKQKEKIPPHTHPEDPDWRKDVEKFKRQERIKVVFAPKREDPITADRPVAVSDKPLKTSDYS
jgi:hypothetical protein